MSRKGNKLITIPQGVEVTINKDDIVVKGKNGQLTIAYNSKLIKVINNDGIIKVERTNEIKQTKMLHGTVNANLNNAIIGVSQGYTKVLKITGVGYKASIVGNQLVLAIGFSHPVKFDIPAGLTATCENPTTITIFGACKILVGEFAANVRITRKPEPYKGKGIAYSDERIIRKVGKTAEGSKK